MNEVTIGLERAAKDPSLLGHGRIGLLMNQASLDRHFRYAHHLLHPALPQGIDRLFSPQHGLFSEEQDNMIESTHAVEPSLSIPIWSLYSETRKPTKAMLEGLDTLVIDLFDVGVRVYTYVWTLTLCMEACRDAGVKVIVLDRPNPLGGEIVEGPCLHPGFESFVGRATIPMRHGLTLGELALFLDKELRIGAHPEVVTVTGWNRAMLHGDTGRPWVPPSPNLPRYEGALVYPGQVLLEGTVISEGRGTTTPFEVAGYPGVDPFKLVERLGDLSDLGVTARPFRFRPTFQKHAGKSVGGVFFHVLSPTRVRSFTVTLRLLAALKTCVKGPLFNPPPYEYEHRLAPIDILFGSPRLREALVDPSTEVPEAEDLAETDDHAWWDRVGPFLLY